MANFIMKRINPGGVREALCPIYTLADDEEMVFAVLNDLLTWGGIPIEQDFKGGLFSKRFIQISALSNLISIFSYKYLSKPVKTQD